MWILPNAICCFMSVHSEYTSAHHQKCFKLIFIYKFITDHPSAQQWFRKCISLSAASLSDPGGVASSHSSKIHTYEQESRANESEVQLSYHASGRSLAANSKGSVKRRVCIQSRMPSPICAAAAAT